MRNSIFWLLLPIVASAQVSVKVTGATATQAVVQIRGAAEPCTIDLREGAADGPLHPDVTASEDAGRPDTITWQDGTRVVTLGHQRSNLALAADTDYYGTVSGCGSASFTLRTKTPVLGAIMPTPLPVNPAKWHNADFPPIDWGPAGRDKWYVDPMTGVKMKLVNRPEDFSWSYKQDASFATASQGSHWAGGSGWTNPASAANGSTSTARTSNTNPLLLYPGLIDPWSGSQMSIENVGLIVWGRCISATGADCEIEAGIFYNPAEGFAGTPITIRIPVAGSNQKVTGGSSHKYANGAFPASYPQPLFAGWGDVRITHDMRYGPQAVEVSSIVNGVITVAAPTTLIPGHLQRTLRAGHHIWVAGSGCTANGAPDVCTVATNTDAGTLALSETNVNLPASTKVRGLPWGIMVRKKTGTGTVQLGFAYRMSGSNNSATGTTVPLCSPVEQTDPDGVKGHPCTIPERGGSYSMLYFISNDGEVVRPIAGLGSSAVAGLFDSIKFSPTQGNVMFGKASGNIWRGTYNGNWKDSVWDTNGGRYMWNPGGDYPYFDENITWTPAISPDPATQINTAHPVQTSAPYPVWTTYGFAGVSGNLAVLYRVVNGSLVGDTGPCQVAVFNLLTGKLLDFFNTLESEGPVAWGNCHAVGVNSLVDNTVYMSFNRLPRNQGEASSNALSLGPHHMRIEAILKDGAWDSTVALGWPRDTSAFDSACPAGLSEDYTQLGAVGNNCITFLTSGHPCNVTPRGTASPPTGDFALYGTCAWEPSYAGSPRLRAGHRFIDTWASLNPGVTVDGDSEHFRVISVTEEGGGKLRVTAQFNASRDYCAGAGTPQPCYNCVSTTKQMSHRAPWVGFTAMMMPGSKASCNASSIHVTYPNASSPAKSFTELSNAFQGHSSYGRGPDGTFRYLSGGLVGTLNSFSELGTQPPVLSSLSKVATTFNGVAAPIGSYYQQYLNHSQRAATNDKTIFSFDANAVNPGVGISGNDMGNTIGRRNLTRISGDVWKVTPIDTVDYKNRPLLGWAGPKVLKDVSGPSSNVGNAADYSFCYAYKAGECVAASSEGDVYAKVPNAFKHSGWQADWCQTGMEFANIPCVLSGGPSAGYARQFRSDRADTAGSDQRLLTSAFRPYGTHYPYWAVVAHPAGQVALMTSAGFLEGIRHVAFVAKLPKWVDSFPRRNTFGGVAVGIGTRPGVTHARVRFGYNTAFECTERSEACVTDALTGPYAFEQSDTLTPTSCGSGCMISVPALPGRVLYYRIETFDGTAWTSGDTMTATP